MSRRVGLCVDSSAQLPDSLRDRIPVAVVPLTVHLGDAEYLEGVDLSTDDWYAALATSPSVDVTAPSPGQFALAVETLLDQGCTEVLSLHAAPPLCADPDVPACAGSVTSARLAAHRLGVPVRVLEVPVAGFGVGCCAWVAVEAIERGASLDEVVALVECVATRLRHLFLAAPVEVLRRGVAPDGGPRLEVCTVDRHGDPTAPNVSVVASVDTVLDAVNVMATAVVSAVAPGRRVRVAIGHGDPSVEAVADALESAVGETVVVDEVLRYRIGPSSSRLTGPGVVRCFVVPSTPPVSDIPGG